jgi:hypothetical protein
MLLPGELRGDLDDQVLLAADGLPPPDFDQDVARVDAEPLAGSTANSRNDPGRRRSPA